MAGSFLRELDRQDERYTSLLTLAKNPMANMDANKVMESLPSRRFAKEIDEQGEQSSASLDDVILGIVLRCMISKAKLGETVGFDIMGIDAGDELRNNG